MFQILLSISSLYISSTRFRVKEKHKIRGLFAVKASEYSKQRQNDVAPFLSRESSTVLDRIEDSWTRSGQYLPSLSIADASILCRYRWEIGRRSSHWIVAWQRVAQRGGRWKMLALSKNRRVLPANRYQNMQTDACGSHRL